MRRFVALSVLLFLFAIMDSAGHGGGTDAYGCHRDTRAGNYHCHSGEFAGRSFSSQAEMLALRSGRPAVPAATATPSPSRSLSSDAAAPSVEYSRDLYGDWIDADGDCLDTRQEVLIAESLIDVTLTAGGCRVAIGLWYDAYTDTFFETPLNLDIDHLVPLAEVHRSGGDKWTADRRHEYANDLNDSATLIVVSSAANRSKGDRDPSKWMPPSPINRCQYLVAWVQVKRRWGLSMDAEESAAINKMLDTCKQGQYP